MCTIHHPHSESHTAGSVCRAQLHASVQDTGEEKELARAAAAELTELHHQRENTSTYKDLARFR